MDKVFCIGLNRTGTKSFSKAMRLLGRRSLPWSPRALMLFKRGDFDELYRLVDAFQAFDDWPWPLMARQLMIEVPSARFVLTRRTTAEVWLASIRRHAKKTPRGGAVREFVYGAADPEGNEDRYREFYFQFYTKMKETIDDLGCSDRVLSVCWEEGDGWRELCNFLGEEVPERPFPHFNSSKGPL